MRNRQDLINQIKASYGQVNMLTIPRSLVDFMGSLDAALLLAQVIYWSERTKNPAGWFYKTYADWQAELGLSRYEVRRAAKKMTDLGFLATRIKKTGAGVPTIHYRLDWPSFTRAFEGFLQESFSPGDPAGPAETPPPAAAAPPAEIPPEPAAPSPWQEPPVVVEPLPNRRIEPAQALSTRLPNPTILADLKRAPAVKIYRQITNRWPPKETWPAIIDTVGQTQGNLVFWEEVIRTFIDYGWNPCNIQGMLNVFLNGELPSN